MSILDKIITTTPKAPRLTIYGKPGIGKSTLAAQFPSPLFLLTEDPSLNNIQAFPVASSFGEFWDNLKKLLDVEQLPFKTLVIDSVSKLDALIVNYIISLENNGKNKNNTLGSACGGYGKGYEKAQGLHRAVKAMLDNFTARGIAIIFISHLTITKYKAPDSDDYDTYSIVMNHEKSREVYIDDVDAVLFGRLKSFTNMSDSGKAKVTSTKERILNTSVNDVYVAKNRFNMPDEIPMSFEAIKKYIPFYNNNAGE